MKKTVTILLAFTLLCSLFVLSVGAESMPVGAVYDRAGFLDTLEENELKTLLAEAAANTGCSYYIVTHKMLAASDEYWGEDFLDDQNLSQRDDIIVLIITQDKGKYYYDLYTYGLAEDRITDDEVDQILDTPEVYNNLKAGRLMEGIKAFIPVSRDCINTKEIDWIRIIVPLCLGALIGGISCYGVVKSYSTKKKSVDYPLERFAKLELIDRDDRFMGTFVTKRIIQTSSGSRSGGGGGRGGGGGHRGGR